MIDKTVLSACVAMCLVITSSAVAQANPAISMPVIDAAAAQLCEAINANPSEEGVLGGFDALHQKGLDDIDGALVMITAMHHVCPQRGELIMKVIDPLAAEGLCTEPL